MENLLKENPFTDDFVRKEVEFMQYDMSKEIIEYRGLTLKFKEIHGRCDDYLNKNMRFDDWKTPIMFIDGQLWMSLSSMEITSAYMGWWSMSGKVAMLGLGTGYTALKCASQEDVEQVVVYEIDERVVDFFRHLHGHREEAKKIEFVVGDAREKFRGQQFDCVFADIYQTALEDEVLTDIDLFHEHNEIGWYRFWQQELVQLIALNERYLPQHALTMVDMDYLRHWFSTEGSKLYGPHIDTGWVLEAIRKIAEYPGSMFLEAEYIDEYGGDDDDEDECYA